MSEEEAAALFPDGVYSKDLPSGKKYLRYTPMSAKQTERTECIYSTLSNVNITN